MIYNTRFNPTVNGYLHIGHLYNILVNQAEARRSGGTFGVRFDDNQAYWNWVNGCAALDGYRWSMRDDFEWLGIVPDYWHSQAEMLPQAIELMRSVGYCPKDQPFCNYQTVEVVGITGPFYPYAEVLTSEKVVFDFMDGITWAIRGVDLITEDCLYRHFVNVLGLRNVRLTYIPRLIFDGDVLSKTAGCYKIRDFRTAGIDPLELENNLASDCLINKFDGNRDEVWRIDNIKSRPTLGEWAKESLYAVCN
jgi:glutamyl/glutaminyl-tRNA synthetase